jgi:hypothetical protein
MRFEVLMLVTGHEISRNVMAFSPMDHHVSEEPAASIIRAEE